jgi:uncharacterized protein
LTATTEKPSRIATLDIVRGVAVMGILGMNAVGFTMPAQAYFNPAAYGGAEGADLVAWTLGFIFVDGKMRGLFSLLFGASLLLITDAAEAEGRSPAAAHYVRTFWLGVFGAVHYYLIWWGDILLHYALVALVAYFFRRFSLQGLLVAAGLLLLYNLFINIGFSYSGIEFARAAEAPGAEAAAIEVWRTIVADLAPLPPAELAAELAIHRGGFWELAAHRFSEEAWAPIDYLQVGGPETLALMLMGMAGLRSGFLTGAWAAERYRRIAFWCILFGAAGFALAAAIQIRSGFDPETVFIILWGGTVVPRIVMIVGYAALVVLLARHGGAVADRIAAAGRMAFSNYLGTSLVMTFIFYGWGLGLYGTFSRAELWPLIFAIWGLMLLWSKPWLERYRYGPLEWLWRTLSRGRLQPMRRPVPA